MTRSAEWILRVGCALIFAGHGMLALRGNPPWLAFFEAVGLSREFGERWMPMVGLWDLVLAAVTLLRPAPILLLWMTLWALWTALLRPLSGQSWLELVERGGNWSAPLALLVLLGWPASVREWLGAHRSGAASTGR